MGYGYNLNSFAKLCLPLLHHYIWFLVKSLSRKKQCHMLARGAAVEAAVPAAGVLAAVLRRGKDGADTTLGDIVGDNRVVIVHMLRRYG